MSSGFSSQLHSPVVHRTSFTCFTKRVPIACMLTATCAPNFTFLATPRIFGDFRQAPPSYSLRALPLLHLPVLEPFSLSHTPCIAWIRSRSIRSMRPLVDESFSLFCINSAIFFQRCLTIWLPLTSSSLCTRSSMIFFKLISESHILPPARIHQ